MAPAIHGDRDARLLERTGEGKKGELVALVRVEDLRFAVAA